MRSSNTSRGRKENKCKRVSRNDALILKASSSLRRRRRPRKNNQAALIDGNKPLTEPQKRQLTAIKTKFDGAAASLEDAINRVQDDGAINALFPTVVLEKAKVELTDGKASSQHLAQLIVGTHAVANFKEFIAGVKLVQQSMEKSDGHMTDMIGHICHAAGIEC